MTNSQSFLATLPPMPPLNPPICDGVKLVTELRDIAVHHKHTSVSVGAAITPRAVMKYSADGSVDFKSVDSYTQSKTTYDARNLLADKWPDRYESLIGQYIWFNSQGDTIAPIWEGRASLVGEVPWVVLGILSAWSDNRIELHKGIVWLKEGPQVFMPRHLPLMMLSILPDLYFTDVVKNFKWLGQNFMKYFYNWTLVDDNREKNGAATLGPALAKLTGPYSVNDTGPVLNVLRTLLKG